MESVFDNLPKMKDYSDEDDMYALFEAAQIPYLKTFEDFVRKLKNIGLFTEEISKKGKKLQYRFADLYVHGFGMKRSPRKF